VAEATFHPEAQAEYAAAIRWYEERSERAASRFEDEVERVVERIVASPESFPKYDADRRFAVVHRFPYSVVYQLDAGEVRVVAVAHASRAPGYWQFRV
jgi:plasmid stabilization system protein ParE